MRVQWTPPIWLLVLQAGLEAQSAKFAMDHFVKKGFESATLPDIVEVLHVMRGGAPVWPLCALRGCWP